MKKSTKRKPVATTALARRDESVLEMFQRVSNGKGIDADKLEKLIALQERIMEVNAKAAFNQAYTAMVLEIPEIDRKGAIRNKVGEIQSRYSRHEDIQRVVKPILQRFGFSLSYQTEWPSAGMVRVSGILTHTQGHSRTSAFESAADPSGNKNAIQALGSTVSYGRRYSTIDLLNITCKGQDDDGQRTGPRRREPTTTPPDVPPKQPPPVRHAKSGEPITDKQRQRLWVIVRNSGRSEEEICTWLKDTFQWTSTKDVTRDQYDRVCSAIESPGNLT
jgi:hypothetical protein